MRRLAAAGTLALALATGAGATPSSPPKLRLVDMSPLKVAGTRFRPVERIRVTLTRDGARTVRRATTTTRGTFLVSFGTLTRFDPCNDLFTVVAVGGRGDRAELKYLGRECPPAP